MWVYAWTSIYTNKTSSQCRRVCICRHKQSNGACTYDHIHVNTLIAHNRMHRQACTHRSTPINHACIRRHTQIIKYYMHDDHIHVITLIAHNRMHRQACTHRSTPINHACIRRHTQIIKYHMHNDLPAWLPILFLLHDGSIAFQKTGVIAQAFSSSELRMPTFSTLGNLKRFN